MPSIAGDDGDIMEVVSEPMDSDADDSAMSEADVADIADVVATVVDDDGDEDDDIEIANGHSIGGIDSTGDDDDDDDAEDVVSVAEAIDDEDEDDAMANSVASSSKSGPAKKSKKTASAKADMPRSNGTVSKSSAASSSSSSKSGSSTFKAKKKAVKKKPKPASATSSGTDMHFIRVSKGRVESAVKARQALTQKVTRLPLNIKDTFKVRSMGQLQLEPDDKAKFSTSNALYPVGFSCDRIEFCPAHGRNIKVRCTILDGTRISQSNKTIFGDKAPNIPTGPIFRIMWGPGVDASEDSVEFPYNPFVDSSPIMTAGTVDTVALAPTPTSSSSSAAASSSKPSKRLPTVGMRVKTRFEKDQYFYGAIVSILKTSDSDKKKSSSATAKSMQIVIQYDDGSQEQATLPDPDISLVMPGAGDETDEHGSVRLQQLNGKKVTSVIGGTPIQAWSNMLLYLGLVDDVMVSMAMDALQASRAQSLADAKDKVDAFHLNRERGRRKSFQADDNSSVKSTEDGSGDAGKGENGSDASKEKALREQVEKLKAELRELECAGREVTLGLAAKRQSLVSPYLCNPFIDSDVSRSHQTTWLGIAVRKEKTKMGSTGNKRKVVAATDLLERNDTFFHEDVDALVEGLPGSEYCGTYVFQAARISGAAAVNRTFIHEAKLKQERERERQLKAIKEAKAKADQERERELKRKRRENERDERKRQRMEEEDQKKRARAEERMHRLKVQVDERLFREACFQREKVVALLAKSLSKEFNRRRKSAELMAGYNTSELKIKSRGPSFAGDLPPLSKTYNEDILRIWDLITTFGNFFKEREYISALPSLDSLQSMLDVLSGVDDKSSAMSKTKAISCATDLAVALCRPLASGVTRTLFASLIALSPALQKEFGAAFFNEVDGAKKKEGDEDDAEEEEEEDTQDKPSQAEMLLPVDENTWQEIARLAFLADALGELGYTRQEQAHLLRGYRSAGHPNSKEARRIRRVEEFSVAVLRQALGEEQQHQLQEKHKNIDDKEDKEQKDAANDKQKEAAKEDAKEQAKKAKQTAAETEAEAREGPKKPGDGGACTAENGDNKSYNMAITVVLRTPSAPSCNPCDWTFYLHHARLPKIGRSTAALKRLLKSSLQRLQQVSDLSDSSEKNAAYIKEVKNILKSLEGASGSEASVAKSSKARILKLLDNATGEVYSRKTIGSVIDLDNAKTSPNEEIEVDSPKGHHRYRMGQLQSLVLTGRSFKEFKRVRENYMADALKLKAEMKRQELREAGEDIDDDDDDDDEADQQHKSGNGKKNSDEAKSKEGEINGEEKKDDSKSANKDKDGDVKMEDVTETANGGSADIEDYTAEKAKGKDKKKKKNMDTTETEPGTEKKEMKAENTGDEKGKSESESKESTSATDDDDDDDKPDDAMDVTKPDVDPKDAGPKKIGKSTEYDDFCEDIPTAPELIRRCMAVLRSLCQTVAAEPFIYPVDPQSNPGYYDMLLRPMCMREVGVQLKKAAKEAELFDSEDEKHRFVENVVLEFGRNIRLIEANCHTYANAGPMIISAGGEMVRIFERLLLDWVLAPDSSRVQMDQLDDDLCVEPHESDLESTVLLCDGCEGNFNVQRLDPPLEDIPQGDWHCPRCVQGRWWGDLDPRVGLAIKKDDEEDVKNDFCIKRCFLHYQESGSGTPSLLYEVEATQCNVTEFWPVKRIDEMLQKSGKPVPPIQCLEAVAESSGYGVGVDRGLRSGLVPHILNPKVSDAAAQVALTSSVFRDSIAAASTLLLVNPTEMHASEWIRLLILLAMKCSSSDVIQNIATEMESASAEKLSKWNASQSKTIDIASIVSPIPGEEFADEAEEVKKEEETKSSDGKTSDEAANEGEKKESADDATDSSSNSSSPSGDKMDIDAVNGDSGKPGKGEKPQQERRKSIPKGAVAEPETKDEKKPPTSTAENGPTMTLSENAVEVVDSTYYEKATEKGGIAHVQAETKMSEEDERRAVRTAALKEKSKRQKAREDGFSAFCIKNQLRSTVASFEQDTVSQVVESSLASKHVGLSFASSRCRGTTCDFCGLSDTALGSNLVRVPNQKEWDELVVFSSRSRRTNLVADISKEIEGQVSFSNKRRKKILKLSIRIDGDLFCDEKDDELFEQIKEGESLQFVPRNSNGFQDELLFRYEANLPFVTGSLSGHECCAIACHNARKIKLIQQHQRRSAERAEQDAAKLCARTLEIGRDALDRSYWKFNSDPDSLFVCIENDDGKRCNEWHKYSDPESIASVMIALGHDPLVDELKRLYRPSYQLIRDGTWSTKLLKRKYDTKALLTHSEDIAMEIEGAVAPSEAKSTDAMDADSGGDDGDGENDGDGDEEQEEEEEGDEEDENEEEEEEEEEDELFEENEQVLVESTCGEMLWNATVIGVAKEEDSTKNIRYRVRYEGWSSRFDEWVNGTRLVEPNENNLQVQAEMMKERKASRDGLPPELSQMEARKYLRARVRARGKAPLPNFARIARVEGNATPEQKILATMKAAILAIEAALPIGSVDISPTGEWREDIAVKWRKEVQDANGAWSLMRCVVLLEDVISEDWIKPIIGHVQNCLPSHWKALDEASVSAIALRVRILDRAIMYGTVDMK